MAKLLKPVFTSKFRKQFKHLPKSLQKKFNQKLPLLLANSKHPSFRARKMTGIERFEARLTIHYRFTYVVRGRECVLLSIGPHDTGLGKK